MLRAVAVAAVRAEVVVGAADAFGSKKFHDARRIWRAFFLRRITRSARAGVAAPGCFSRPDRFAGKIHPKKVFAIAVRRPTPDIAMAKRKPNAAFMKPVQPDDVLSVVVGSKPLPRTELTKKLWDYIKKNGLQDKKVRTQINADAALMAVFGGKAKVSMFEMTKLVSGHLKK